MRVLHRIVRIPHALAVRERLLSGIAVGVVLWFALLGVDPARGKDLLLDLGEVSFIASSGWSVLLGVRSRLKRANSEWVLAGMNPHLTRTYQAMKLPALIAAYPSVADAEAALLKA